MASTNIVCRVCLQLVHDENVELINEATQKILGLLLIKLNLDVSGDPMICKICSGILDEIYMFKSDCLRSEDIIRAHFKSNIKVNLMHILRKFKNEPDVNIAADEVVCRLCIKVPPNGNYIALNKISEEVSHCRNMMQMQLPEIDLNITEEPIICDVCHVQLRKYLSFVTSYVDVEKKIKAYCEHQGSNVNYQVELLCVLQFTENKAKDCETRLNRDLFIKNEESSVPVKIEKVEEVEQDSLSGSATEFYIKQEEIDIKSEDDQISCNEGTYSTKAKKYLPRRKKKKYIRPKPKVVLYCDQCNFRTNYKNSLGLHKKRHDPTKPIFKCEQCEYSTHLQARLKDHQVTHMKLGETKVYSCTTCEFKTKYKSSCNDHMKRCLKKKDEADVDTMAKFQCKQCNFRTKSIWCLHVHKKRHDPAQYKFKCEHCEYCTYFRARLKQHQVTHMELGETLVYECATCGFKSKYKSSLKNHIEICSKKKEQDDTDSRVILQCNQCDFRTNYNTSYYKHKKTHKDKHKFKCQQCQFWSYSSAKLDQHLVTHLDVEEALIYYCATCDFKSKYKASLRGHIRRCIKKNTVAVRLPSKKQDLVLKQENTGPS